MLRCRVVGSVGSEAAGNKQMMQLAKGSLHGVIGSILSIIVQNDYVLVATGELCLEAAGLVGVNGSRVLWNYRLWLHLQEFAIGYRKWMVIFVIIHGTPG